MLDRIPDPGGVRFAFGPFILSPGERLLWRGDDPVEIGGRAFALLQALVEAPGRVVSKRELMLQAWSDVQVEDGSLRFHLVGPRKALQDGVDGARYIDTQIGTGYALVVPVRRIVGDATERRSVEAAAGREKLTVAGRLPARLTPLIGREEEKRLLADRILDAKLFTIVGAAGIGKTTLAVELAHTLLPAFANWVYFVDLAALESGDLLGSAIASALGVAVQAEDPTAVVLGNLRNRRLMRVLDNCEHLIGYVCALVERIGDVAPAVTVLAASREPLRAWDEQVHWLGPLDCPDDPSGLSADALLSFSAIGLFVTRARAASGGMIADVDSLRRIAQLCRRLEGMALPIELTAMCAVRHGLESTAQLLGERFSLGWTGRRTARPRQQTLQATLDWSYDLLDEAERRTLEGVSVFVGSFSLQAALSVVADTSLSTERAAAALDELVAKSLVAFDQAAGANPFRLPGMTRAYVRGKLLARSEATARAVARRHAEHFLSLLENVLNGDRTLHGAAVGIDGQIGNIRSALAAAFGPEGDGALAVRLTAATAPVFLTMSLLVECRTWCARALSVLDGDHAGSAVELELQAALGLSLMFTRGNVEAVGAALLRAYHIAVELSDRWAQLRMLGRLHIYHDRIGNFAIARDWACKALDAASVIDEPEAHSIAASLFGISCHLAGDEAEAQAYLERAVRDALPSQRFRTIHYGFDHRNRSLIALARTLWLRGCADRALRVADDAVREVSALDHPATHCIALVWALSVHIARGDLTRARETLDLFASIAEANAFGPYAAAAPGLRASPTIRESDADQAVAPIEESLARLRAARYDLLTTSLSMALTIALSRAGRHTEAIKVIDNTIERSVANGEHIYTPNLLRIKAEALTHADENNRQAAGHLLEDALAWARKQHARAWELRAALAFYRLECSTAGSAQATTILRSLRQSFDEGLDTADLRAADALLAGSSELIAGA